MNLRIHVISESVVRKQQGRESSKTKDTASERNMMSVSRGLYL